MATWPVLRWPCSTHGTAHLIDRLSYSAADDVTMGPDGSLYWTDLLDGNGLEEGARRSRHLAIRRGRA